MPTNRNEEMMVYCSFCGKNQDEVQKIIAGNNAFICNECVELAQEIIREELAEEVLADLSEVPKPQELLQEVLLSLVQAVNLIQQENQTAGKLSFFSNLL